MSQRREMHPDHLGPRPRTAAANPAPCRDARRRPRRPGVGSPHRDGDAATPHRPPRQDRGDAPTPPPTAERASSHSNHSATVAAAPAAPCPGRAMLASERTPTAAARHHTPGTPTCPRRDRARPRRHRSLPSTPVPRTNSGRALPDSAKSEGRALTRPRRPTRLPRRASRRPHRQPRPPTDRRPRDQNERRFNPDHDQKRWRSTPPA